MRKNLVESLRDKGYSVRISHYRPYNITIVDDNKIDELKESNFMIPSFKLEEFVIQNPLMNKFDVPKHLRKYVMSNGGYTQVEVTRNGEVMIECADCSYNDAFCRRRGVQIAVCRIAKKLGIKL